MRKYAVSQHFDIELDSEEIRSQARDAFSDQPEQIEGSYRDELEQALNIIVHLNQTEQVTAGVLNPLEEDDPRGGFSDDDLNVRGIAFKVRAVSVDWGLAGKI